MEKLTTPQSEQILIDMRREGIKYVFYQDIYKTSGETCIKAVVETVCTVNGRISRGEEFLPYFEKYLQ